LQLQILDEEKPKSKVKEQDIKKQAKENKKTTDELIEEYEKKINKTKSLLEEEKKKVAKKGVISGDGNNENEKGSDIGGVE